ncbi:WecB/TagA/CpsF family glycosyltransferase [Ornithinimicrobium kibberense]|uniref:WecB/TagA/CpsF family glycosyltransferase n=1 Tax=Ornithinimicrobium kibberense TaxID=282060 RepID=A0ABV5V6B7_9MICO|nr:WecB/TagA/CpsF family glycosyltransferase [Ornithinimicrobium kibberense]
MTEKQTVEAVLDELRQGRGGWLVTPNIDILQRSRDATLRELVNSANLVVCDGMPVIWAARLAGTPLPERVTGSSLIWTLTAGAAREGHRVFLLGAADGVAELAAHQLNARHPGAEVVVGVYSPPLGFERSAEQMALLTERLHGAHPAIVFCGFGFPKQERLIQGILEEFPGVWFVGCGGAIDMAAERIPRAPTLLQRVGLEWAYRLVREPRRLARRYLLDDLPFALLLLMGTTTTGIRTRAHRVHLRGNALAA